MSSKLQDSCTEQFSLPKAVLIALAFLMKSYSLVFSLFFFLSAFVFLFLVL